MKISKHIVQNLLRQYQISTILTENFNFYTIISLNKAKWVDRLHAAFISGVCLLYFSVEQAGAIQQNES